MSLTRGDVEKVALLARLDFGADELAQMTVELGRIVEYIDQLGEVDTQGVEPLAHPIEVHNVFREDRVEPSLDREAALANAPRHDRECYLVPAVLGE